MKSLRLSRPHAVMMVGIPGSGKTFFAERFAELFDAPYIDTLVLEQASREGEAGNVIAYVMSELAKTKQTFVYEGNSDTRVSRTEFARWARDKGYQPMFVWVQLDTTTAKARTKKNGTISQEEFLFTVKSFSPPHTEEKAVVISGKHTFATQLKVVLNYLSKNNRSDSQPIIAAPKPRPQQSRSITVQ